METRTCTECKKKMTQGFVIYDGDEYYCCDKCLMKHYTPKQYLHLFGEDLAYWTEF